MMRFLFLVLIGCSSGYGTNRECFYRDDEGNCTLCPGAFGWVDDDELCFRGERHYPCHASMDDCKSKAGLKDAKSGASVDCKNAVAKIASVTNEQCGSQCEEIVGKGKDPTKEAWDEQCGFIAWSSENGRAVLEAEFDCYYQWVHGYSEPSNLAGFKMIAGIETPAKCQALCQQEANCTRFVYATDLAGDGRAKMCSLKNEDQIRIPSSIEYVSDANPDNFDVNYCNTQMHTECWDNHYDCAPCQDQVKRCIWKSYMHVNGPKHCAKVGKICDDDDNSESTQPESTPPCPGCNCGCGCGCGCNECGKNNFIDIRIANRPKVFKIDLRN